MGRLRFRLAGTSPGNYQAWLAVRGAHEIERELKETTGAGRQNGRARLAAAGQ
jgi:hypothetical protein